MANIFQTGINLLAIKSIIDWLTEEDYDVKEVIDKIKRGDYHNDQRDDIDINKLVDDIKKGKYHKDSRNPTKRNPQPVGFGRTIDDFFSLIKNEGLAPKNRYWIEFNLPRGIPDSASGSEIQLSARKDEIRKVNSIINLNGRMGMMCHAVQMPGRTFQVAEHKYYQNPHKIPYTAQYDDITLAFTASKNLLERQFFEVWQETVFNIRSGTMNYYNEYVSNVKIHQLDLQGNSVYSVTLIDAFPISIDAMDYSYMAQSELQTINVTLSYKYWINENLENLGA